MKQRNIAMAIIFSFLTCGIYFIIWLWCLNNELRTANNKNLNSGTNFLLSFITCGIYSLVWMYKLVDEVGFMLISVALAQHQVNKICQKNQN